MADNADKDKKLPQGNGKLYAVVTVSFLAIGMTLFLICWLAKPQRCSFDKNQFMYQEAVRKTRFPVPDMIDTNLFCLKPSCDSCDSVDVVTFKSASNMDKYKNDTNGRYNVGAYENWVTSKDEIDQVLRNIITPGSPDTVLRLQQLLGLPYSPGNYDFVVIRVAYSSLFRPCPDSAISDCKCDLSYNEKTDPEYIKWFNAQRTKRFFKIYPEENYPFTQLGYTYDWNPDNDKHFGLSEYVIKRNTIGSIRGRYTLSTYFAGLFNP